MKIDVTDLSPVKKSMVIEVPLEEVARETEQVLRRYRQQARIPGFRPGKAPLSVIRARFADAVRDDVKERVVASSYSAATREKGLRPVGDPLLEDLVFEDGQPVRFKTTFEVIPEIRLRNVKGLEVRRPAWTVTGEDVDQLLEQLRGSRARFVSDEGRQAQLGDLVVADVEGRPEGGETFRQERMAIEVGAQENFKAFNEGLLGVGVGRELELDVTYAADHSTPALAGKLVRYALKVLEVKRKELPALDDEFAKDMGDFADLPALRARVEEDIGAGKARDAERAMRQSLLDKLLLENPVVLPQVLVDEEIRDRLEDLVRQFMMRGLDPEKLELDWVDLRQRQEEPARKAVHARLILDAVAAAESLSAGRDEIEARIRAEAQRARLDPTELRARLVKEHRLEALTVQLVREKALDYLTSVANIHEGS